MYQIISTIYHRGTTIYLCTATYKCIKGGIKLFSKGFRL